MREDAPLPLLGSIFSTHAATESLIKGGQSACLPIELVHFLFIKRLMPFESLSPSPTVDSLWHWMLLNSKERDAVHAMIGGDVPHSTSTQEDDEPTKAVRVARALTLMERSGFTPNLDHWRTDTRISRVSFDVTHRGKSSSSVVYLAQCTQTKQQIVDQVKKDLAITEQSIKPGSHIFALAASDTPKRLMTIADLGIKEGSDVNVHKKSQEHVNLVVKNQSGDEVHFKVDPSIQIWAIKRAYCEMKGIDMKSIKFVFGRRIMDETPDDLDMEDGDVIDAFIEQCGC